MTITGDHELFARRYHDRRGVPLPPVTTDTAIKTEGPAAIKTEPGTTLTKEALAALDALYGDLPTGPKDMDISSTVANYGGSGRQPFAVPSKNTSTSPRSSEIPTDEELFAFMDAMRTKMLGPLKNDSRGKFDLSYVHYMYPLCCGEDYHTWVVDKHGKVVYDPYFKDYDLVRKVQDCWGKQRRQEWDGVYQKMVWQDVQRRAKGEMREIKKQGGTAAQLWAFRETEKPFHCSTNCMCFKKKPENQGKGYRIAIGSMGWEKADGSVHWEYGDGLVIPKWSRR